MIPVLFAPSAKSFATNGIGRLPEMVTCEVTEERNGVYELTATIGTNCKHYADIVHSAIIGVVPHDGGSIQAFRIYKISKPIGGIITINAQHISYELSHIPARPFTAANVTAALAGLKSNSMQTNPFTFWTDKATVANYNQAKPESIRARLGGQQGSILDVYGGEYEFDNYAVKLWNNRGTDRNVTLRYGKNITDIKQEENIANTITGIVPYWCGGDDETVYYNGIVEASTAANFPYRRTVPYDFSSDFETAPTAAQLRQRAERYIIRNSIGIPAVSIKVSFVALWQTEEYKDIAPLQRVNLCDYVTIQFERLGISAKAKVIKTVYDVLNERYKSIELGEARTDFASYVVGLSAQTAQNAEAVSTNKNYVMTQIDQKLITFEEVMNEAIEDATDLIRGAKGGNIVTRLNAQGLPYELLITDNLDLQMAKNVWRWNIGGLGFSKNGYNGTYGLAITQNGAIVADFITTGTLTANLIRAGTIRDLNNQNFWNLETGDFRLAPGASVGNKTLSNYVSDTAKNVATPIANDAARRAVVSQTQLDIFNKLTNNGQMQGIYMQNGLLYINAEFLKAGVISDSAGENAWNLVTGEFITRNIQAVGGTFSGSINGGTITIGGTAQAPIFSVNSDGKVVMKNFELDGTGNAGTIGCTMLNTVDLHVQNNAVFEECPVFRDGIDIQGGIADLGSAEANDMWVTSLSCNTISCQNPPWSYDPYDDSDRRLKRDITDIDGADALAFILALNPKKYTLIKDEREALGFIAQDIQDAMKRLNVSYPLIKERDDGMLALNYQNLLALIVSAIQQLAR